MASVNVNLSCDLQHPVRVQYLDGNMFSMDNGGNTINVLVYDNGEPAQIGGTVTANVIRADGGTVAVTGSLSGNKVTIVMPQACYAVTGAVSVIIKLTQDTTVTTIAAFVANVYRSSTDTVVDPGTIIQSVEDLIADIEGAVADIPVAYNASFAPAYSNSSTYAVGQYVTYDGYLWRCTTAITTAESWTSGHWTKVALAEELSDVKSAFVNNEINNNAFDILLPIIKTNTNANPSSGVSFTWNADGTVLNIDTNGYASTGLGINNIFNVGATSFPDGVKPGSKIRILSLNTDENVYVQVFVSTNGTSFPAVPVVAVKVYSEYTVPSDATGMKIRIATSSGVNLNNLKIKPQILTETLTNEELKNLSEEAFKDRGILPDNTDIDDVRVEGHYILASSRTYTHSPVSGVMCTLEVMKTLNNTIMQRLSVATTGREYIRFTATGTFPADWFKGVVDFETFNSKGVLADGTDLDDITTEGHYLVTNGYTYDNAPFETPATYPSTLEVLKTTNNTILQRLTSVQMKKVYYRQTTLGVFPNTWWVTNKENIDKVYTFDDLDSGKYLAFRTAMYVSELELSGYSCKLIPVKKGTTAHIRTAAQYPIVPYGKIKFNYLVQDRASFIDQSNITYVDDDVSFDYDGFIAVNCINGYYKYFKVALSYGTYEDEMSGNLFTDAPQNPYNFIPEYDTDNPCKYLKRCASLMGAIHHWGIIGASYDSGEFNWTRAGATIDQLSSLDYYEYSWGSMLKNMNGIPDMYHYSNGGQNAKQWITLTGDPQVDGTGRGFCYPEGVETVSQSWNGGLSTVSGIGPGGGCWWKLKDDVEHGKGKQAYIIVLGSNDINNNNPHDSSWNELTTYDESIYYKAGTTEDIGTYDLDTDTDTVPDGKTAGVVPGIVNSYAAYMGAILNRLIAIQPDCVIFLATIRNNFAWNENSIAIWNEYNGVLKDIAVMPQYADNVYLIDFAEYGPNYMQKDMHDCLVGYHPNAIGYHEVAYYYGTLIDYAIRNNFNKLKLSQFIGTGKTYDPAST